MIAYPQSIDFDFYRSYHQNPFNKAIHLICIPILSLCFLNFASIIKADRALLLFYSCYYFSLSLKVGIVMTIHLVGLYKFAKSLRFVVPKWREYTFNLFIFAWILQFIGHKIEGKKPSFFEDIQFLLIGPAWLLGFIYKKFKIKF